MTECVCGGEARGRNELRVHCTSPLPSRASSIPTKSSQRPLIHQLSSVRATATLRGCQKAPSVTYYPRRCPAPASAHACTPSPLRKFGVRRRRVFIKVTMVICTPGGGGRMLAFWFSALRWRRLNTNQRSDLAWSFIKRRPVSGSRVAHSRSHPRGIRREL